MRWSTPGLFTLCSLLVGTIDPLVAPRAQAQTTPSKPADPSTLVEFTGQVEFAVAGSDRWAPARTNLTMQFGDRLRTGQDGRATLQLSDRSVIRLDHSSLLEIKRPRQGTARKGFRVWVGRLFFLNREQPSDIEFETPLVTGAIRGTEFVLNVGTGPAATYLALLDGNVSLEAAGQQVDLASGEQVQIEDGKPVQKSPLVLGSNLVQWCLYYPMVLNAEELTFSPEDRSSLATALRFYSQGDARRALLELPPLNLNASSAVRTFHAALRLAVGQFDEADKLLANGSDASGPQAALRELIAAVSTRAVPATNSPATSTEWLARSYYLQSRVQLTGALAAAQRAVERSPNFGAAWVRLAELQWAFGKRAEATAALAKAAALAPRHPFVPVLRGFIDLAEYHVAAAQAEFEAALSLDGAIGDAWLGRALCFEKQGRKEDGRKALQIAAALEPQRAALRSYLGKAWSTANDPARAEKELNLAKRLDQGDPTAWLYSALFLNQENRFNRALGDLEHAIELNDNRALFRSRLLLDEDRSIRSADVAAIYTVLGMNEVSERSSARAIEEDYANFSGHLFHAQSLQNLEDPSRFNLRFETARESELLVANLLAPPGAGNLSQQLSQQDRLRYFDAQPFGLSSLTQYGSRGDWTQAASAFGQLDGFGYALDSQYVSFRGDRPNQDLERLDFSFQGKQQITPDDSLYLQAGWMKSTFGDLAQYYDPAQADLQLRGRETQEPTLLAGWHHQWAPGSHTLLLASRLADDLTLHDPNHGLLFLRRDASGAISDVGLDHALFDLDWRSALTVQGVEMQHILESSQHALVVGGRFQAGDVDTRSLLSGPLPPPLADQSASPGMERANAYAYYHWRPVTSLQLTAGLAYDWLSFPRNVDLPPIESAETSHDLISPKFGVTYSPWQRTHLRGAYTRSLGGLYFDNSIRLEPTQVAGFNQAFRSLIPESVAGLVPGTEFETFGLGLDQSLPTRTYFGVEAELLRSNGQRDVGAVTNSIPVPVPDSPTTTRQSLNFEERTLSFYVNQLIGEELSLGARYRISRAALNGRFPDIPASAFGAAALNQDDSALLHQADLFARFNHRSGFFAEWDSLWSRQSNQGYSPALPGDDFWQHNLYAGYRLRRHRAELRLGVLNLTDHDYRLNPLNLYLDLPRSRTFVAQLKLNF